MSASDDPTASASRDGLTLVYAAGQGDGKDRGTQPPRPRGPGRARDRRPLGAGARAAGARRGQPDRGLQPAAGRDHAPVPRHRRRQAGAPDAHRARHLRRPALRRRQDSTSAPPRTWSRLMHDRRRGVPVLQGVPDRRRHHPRHHRRPGRQHDDGARGADARGAGHRDGGAQLRRHRHRAGRAHRRARLAQSRARSRSPACWSTAWWSPRSPSTTCRPSSSRTARRSPARSGCRRATCADADERAQDHRPPRRARTARQLRWSTWASACPRACRCVAAEEKVIDLMTLTAEPGVIGGIPAAG